ncbi:MAG: hypothetical protein KJZ69_06990 [Phycisphaerales bacterium]|nr:hypothetical protein [Phycisphaerales bacterium]
MFTPTVPPGGETGNFSGISPTSGLIVGSSLVNDRSRPAAWRIGVGSTLLQPLPGGVTSCYNDTANDAGWMVGGCDSPNRSALWPRLEAPIDLGSLGNQFGNEGANDINAHGEIVGRSYNAQRITRPYLWRNGQMIDIGVDPPPQTGVAYGINDLSEVVGYESDPFRWHDGRMTKLPRFRSCFCTARAINNFGLIVGEENMDDRCRNGYEHAVAWEDAGQGYVQYDLNDFIPRFPDVTLRSAEDVNDGGQIAAFGEYDDGRERGLLVTPYLFEMSDPVPGRAGTQNTITVTGLAPNQRVHLIWGTQEGAQKVRAACPGGTLLIRDPLALPAVRADVNGVAMITVNVPLIARGRTIRMQAIAPFECEISHTVTWTFE